MKHIVDGVDQPGDSRVRRKLRMAMDLEFQWGGNEKGNGMMRKDLLRLKRCAMLLGKNDGEIGVLNDLRRNDSNTKPTKYRT